MKEVELFRSWHGHVAGEVAHGLKELRSLQMSRRTQFQAAIISASSRLGALASSCLESCNMSRKESRSMPCFAYFVSQSL